ncbi:MAG: hypothetical protein D6797_02860, partial [Bdellovibrio sp.]
MFVYPYNSTKIEVPGKGNFSTFGSCLVDNKGEPYSVKVGSCEGCGFLNAVDYGRLATTAQLSTDTLHKQLDQGILPIAQLVNPNLITRDPFKEKVRGGPTAIIVDNISKAKKVAENCPECLQVTTPSNISSLLTGINPIIPSLLYNTTALTTSTTDIDSAFETFNSSLTPAMSYGIPELLKVNLQDSILSDPQKASDFFYKYREPLVNRGLAGIVVDTGGSTSTILNNFCGFEKSFRALAGRETSYVLGRKQVINGTLYQGSGFDTVNKRNQPVIQSSLCVNSTWLEQKGYSVVCFAKDTQGNPVVKTFSPQDISSSLSDPITYDVYAPIIASLGRSSGIYVCNKEEGIYTYTYDLIPQRDNLGEAPILVIPPGTKQDSYFSGNDNAACFKEPLTDAQVLRETGQSLENLNCYVKTGCCKTTSPSDPNPGKTECEKIGGWYNATSGLCYYSGIDLTSNYNSLNDFTSTRVAMNKSSFCKDNSRPTDPYNWYLLSNNKGYCYESKTGSSSVICSAIGWRYARGIGCYNSNGNKLDLYQLNREIANSGWSVLDGVGVGSPAPVLTSNSFCGGGDANGIWLMDGEAPKCLEYKYDYSTDPVTVTYKGSKSWSAACSENNGYYKSGVCYYDKKDVRTACN